MFFQPHDSSAVNHRIVEQPTLVVETPAHTDAPAPPAPSAEQVQAIDGAFIHQHREQETIASFLGLRLSVLLMHDLAQDAVMDAEEKERADKLLLEDGAQHGD